MKDAALKPRPATERAGVLLPLPLSGAYDYRLADVCRAEPSCWPRLGRAKR